MRRQRIERSLGMPLVAIAGLSLLAAPRAIAHDLGVVSGIAYSVMTFAPMAVWLGVVLWRRVPNALLTLLAIGACYGLLLGVVHVALWSESFGDSPPQLGGNLEGVLPSAVEGIVLRGFSLLSSLVTGTAVGAGLGVVGWLAQRLVPGLRPRATEKRPDQTA